MPISQPRRVPSASLARCRSFIGLSAVVALLHPGGLFDGSGDLASVGGVVRSGDFAHSKQECGPRQ